MKNYFPQSLDLKIIQNEIYEKRNGSLAKLAQDLDLKRIGSQHQAGSDSLLTILCFHKMVDLYFKDGVAKKIFNKVYGLTHDTAYISTTTSTNTNNNIDMTNNYYNQYFNYMPYYNTMNFQDNSNYYIDQTQQMFNPYNFPNSNGMQRLDFGSV